LRPDAKLVFDANQCSQTYRSTIHAGNDAAKRIRWVNRVTLVVGRPLPVYPDQRTFLWFVGMSQMCQ
jgi:hypothetical protein